MKKLFLGVVALTLTFTLTACGTSANSATITSLGNQLDETANTISNIQTVNPADLNITKTMLETMTADDTNERLYNSAYSTQQNLLNEEYYKTDILRKTANIKNSLSNNIKLSKAQISAVKDLTSNLAKYTNSISYSENEMTSSLKSISSMKKNIAKNSDRINAKLNRLACNSNSRSAYYENLLNTLDQIENCLNVDSTNTENAQTTPNDTEGVSETQNNTTNNTQTKQKTGLTKNIDTYTTDETNLKNNYNHRKNRPYNHFYNDYNQGYTPNFTYYNNPYVNENYYNSTTPYRNVYNRFSRFNPSRNTDTYGPTTRNIDTYNYNGINNGYYGYGINGIYRNGINYGNGCAFGTNGLNGNCTNRIYNSNNFNRLTTPYATACANTDSNQEPRLEDYEEVKDDNTVEKISPKNNVETLQTENNNVIDKQEISDINSQEINKNNVKILPSHKEDVKENLVDVSKINDDDELNKIVKAH